MKKLALLIIFLLTPMLCAQSQFGQFISYVNSLVDSIAKQAVVDSFMTYARSQGIPFIEDSTANFIYLGNQNTVSVPGDFNNWNVTSWQMTRLSQTNLWYRSELFEMDARLDYKFYLNGIDWILDPENPHTCEGGFGPNSELSMPFYIQPWEINFNPNIQHGTVVSKTIFSSIVGTNYQLNIYFPPGYDSLSSTIYPTVYFQDGTDYIDYGKAVYVIDNLLDSLKIQPVIGVFVKPNNRDEEYAGSVRNLYRLFFVNELVTYIDSNYKTEVDPKERLVLGDSYGGNISALISYNHPEIFGLCGLHSGAFQPNGYEAYNLIVNGPVKEIKWSSIWGSYEGSLTQNMRSLKDYLLNANYELDWLERPEGHSWGLWRASIDRMLEYFFPDNSSGITAENNFIPDDIILYQNYPNPFNPSTNIRFEVPHSTNIKLVLYDLLGREVRILFEGEALAGVNEIELNAENLAGGIYFYRLISEDFIATKKLMLLK
jgi:enterochelin esterase-like enzyme